MKSSLLAFALLALVACPKKQDAPSAQPAKPAAAAAAAPEPSNLPPLDPRNIVSIAMGSKDHTTLVAALKAADYVTSVANPGPFTVFAPTNAAFEKLGKATLDTLLKPENREKLQEILKYHVAPAVYRPAELTDGMTLGMANGGKTKISARAGKLTVNGANIVASIRASNGIVHVIDGVLQPPAQ